MTPLDYVLAEAGWRLSSLLPPPGRPRPYPAQGLAEGRLDASQKRRSAALMRVNHAGEVAAQGLYLGQALAAGSATTRMRMRAAAGEEADHLRWCRRRLGELGSRPSLLTPLWGAGSLAIGLLAGLGGDRRSLGFVEETERQVGAHLESHLARLPRPDARSRAIVGQMKEDEDRHRRQAIREGAAGVPAPVRRGMAAAARVMTQTAYWL